ncbi:choline/carnitine O-acyltransferase [Janibacter sp. GS2]|uniref:choline/carnitine O-acyltransferase n=1 Tax=Janibacter sp. GS2 TaxID=3442646 RepID=UPI003EBF75E5
MKHLPVPPLRQSLDRYLAAVRPLSDAGQQRRAEEVVEEFAVTDGPVCQAELLDFADEEDAAGRSWLSRAWLSSYLTDRSPLPLSSSVGFRLRWDSESAGLARAADLIHRAASVHLAYLRGEIADEVSPRGDWMDMRQWRVLAGGARHPQPGEDVFREGRREAGAREIGVVWQGRCLMVPISDEAGRPVSRPAITAVLGRIQELDLPEDDTFTHVSYLGSDRASDYLDALVEHPDNAQLYDRLVDALFVVNLTDTAASDEEHQERVSFHPGQAWAYKPLTYQVGLVDDFVGLHVEHSVVDGATVRAIVAVMQGVQPTDGEEPPPRAEPLTWTMTDDLRSRLARDIAAYQQQAEAQRVHIVRCPRAVPADLPFRVSHDALQQLSILYAQLAAYGRVRSTYEAVDMREYQAGRTECLRPVGADALALVRAVLGGDATPEHLRAALAEHKDQVIACKSGHGFDRHLTGLALMAGRLGLSPIVFEEESYDRVTTDFLSTSSLGDSQQMVRFTFAPTSGGGIGVNYTVTRDGYEFAVIVDVDRAEPIGPFLSALEAGVEALGQLVVDAFAGSQGR